MVLERVVALESVDPSQDLQVSRLRVDAEPAGIRDGVGEGPVALLEPPGVPRDGGHLPAGRAPATTSRGRRPGR